MNTAETIRAAHLELRFKLPGQTAFQLIPLILTDFTAQVLKPLDRNHDLDFLPAEQQRAILQKKERKQLADYLSRIFAENLIRHIEEQDPVNGYTAAENRTFNQMR